MSDPSEKSQANPHPVSGHRTPREIDKDEAGPIGQADVDVLAKKVHGENSVQERAVRQTHRAATSKRRAKRR